MYVKLSCCVVTLNCRSLFMFHPPLNTNSVVYLSPLTVNKNLALLDLARICRLQYSIIGEFTESRAKLRASVSSWPWHSAAVRQHEKQHYCWCSVCYYNLLSDIHKYSTHTKTPFNPFSIIPRKTRHCWSRALLWKWMPFHIICRRVVQMSSVLEYPKYYGSKVCLNSHGVILLCLRATLPKVGNRPGEQLQVSVRW